MTYTSADDSSLKPVKCDNCGYEWQYSGELPNTTCPSCQRKTSTTDSDE